MMDICRAVRQGTISTVKTLLSSEDVNFLDIDGRTPLLEAARYGHTDIVELLLAQDGIDVNYKDRDGCTPLWWAVDRRQKEVVERLLAQDCIDVNCEDRAGRTPLSKAARVGHKDVVGLLLAEHGIQVNSKESDGQTPLGWAAENGHDGVVELLLAKNGIDANCKKSDGRTPLSCAAQYGHWHVVKLLIAKSHVDVNCRDQDGRTPLSWAAGNGHKIVVNLLLEKHGVDVACEDSSGRTPLSWAVDRRHTDVVKLLLVKQCAIRPGQTLLSWAAENGHHALVQMLLEAKDADPNSSDIDGRTPLSRAAENGHEAIVELLAPINTVTMHLLVQEGKYATVKRLITAGYNLNTRNHWGETPLHVAVASSHLQIARDLILYGAEINAESSDGITPLRLAIRMKDDALIRELLKYKACMKDIMAEEWHDVRGKDDRVILQISQGNDRSNHVDFVTTFPTARELSEMAAANRTCLLYVTSFRFTGQCTDISSLFVDDSDSLWTKLPISGSFEPVPPNKLQISLPRKTDSRDIDISVSLWFPKEEISSPKYFSIRDGGKCRIAWKMIRSADLRSTRRKPVVYFSTLPYGWIPSDEMDLFKQFIVCIKGRWLRLCQHAEGHLSERVRYNS
jgi:ankyrin repeat protein